MAGLVINLATGEATQGPSDHVTTDVEIKQGQRDAIIEQIRALDAGMARVAEELASGSLSQAGKDRVALRLLLRDQLAKLS